MRTVLSLFAKSPFKGLSAHMEKGRECYILLKPLFEAAFAEDYDKVDEIFRQIHEMEHEADILKDDIRSALPKSLFLPVDRRDLLNVLTAQDSVPDTVEDIAMLVRIRPTKYPKWLQDHVMALLEASLRESVLADRPEAFPALCIAIDKLDKIGADEFRSQVGEIPGIDAAGVDHNDLIHSPSHRSQAVRQHVLLITDDHAETEHVNGMKSLSGSNWVGGMLSKGKTSPISSPA